MAEKTTWTWKKGGEHGALLYFHLQSASEVQKDRHGGGNLDAFMIFVRCDVMLITYL